MKLSNNIPIIPIAISNGRSLYGELVLFFREGVLGNLSNESMIGL